MRPAKRESNHHSNITLAICPSDKHKPVYLHISYLWLSGLLIVFLLVPLYSVFIFRNSEAWQDIKNDYRTIKTTNQAQSGRIAQTIERHQELRDHIHRLKIQEEEIKQLLSINFDSQKEKEVDYFSYPMINTHRIVSKKGEVGRVLIDDKIVVEYFDSSLTRPAAYQRAGITAERIKRLLASGKPVATQEIRKTGDDISGYINDQLVFTVELTDLENKEDLSTQALAKVWLSNIRSALEEQQEDLTSLTVRFPLLDRERRKASLLYKKLYPSIAYPEQAIVLDGEANRQGIRQVNHLLKLAQQDLDIYRSSFDDLTNTVRSYKNRFEHTPSTYPVRNSFVLSDFGWRVHPILRRVIFHSGVDLPSWENAPIYSTAAGRVVKSGWHGGYGNMIEIEHGHGFTTMYSHNKVNLVKIGQTVTKGQLIARVGMTGLAQGPHCHYEVRFFDRPVNPNRFLNLDIFSASKNW